MKRTCSHHAIIPAGKINNNRDLRIVFEEESSDQKPNTGYLVWLTAHHGHRSGFITWAETSVIELSPSETDAWRFASAPAARTAAVRGLGPNALDYRIVVYTRRPA